MAECVGAQDQALARGRARDTELEARGLLPTAECPVLYRTAGKNGFALFLYLEKPLDVHTLNRLARGTELADLVKAVAGQDREKMENYYRRVVELPKGVFSPHVEEALALFGPQLARDRERRRKHSRLRTISRRLLTRLALAALKMERRIDR